MSDYDILVGEEKVTCDFSRRFVGTAFRGMKKAGDAVFSGMATAVRETGKHTKVKRLKMKLPKLRHDLQRLRLALGAVVHEQVKQGEENILQQESTLNLLDQLEKCEERIALIRTEIALVEEEVQTEVQKTVDTKAADSGTLPDLARNDADEQRFDAIPNIVQPGDEETTPVLVGALGNRNPLVRLDAIRGLYRLYTEESINSLLDALADDHPDVRTFAVIYLGWTGDIGFSDDIAHLLKDDDNQVRRSAAIALGNLSSHLAIEPLIDALNDLDIGVQQQVVIALRRITHQFFGFKASQYKAERYKAVAGWRDWWADRQPITTAEQSITEKQPIVEERHVMAEQQRQGFRLIQDKHVQLIMEA